MEIQIELDDLVVDNGEVMAYSKEGQFIGMFRAPIPNGAKIISAKIIFTAHDKTELKST